MFDNTHKTEAELSPLEELAFPFLQAAVRLDTVKQNLDHCDEMLWMVDSNAALWTYFRGHVSEHFQNIPRETTELLDRISDFMTKASIVLRREPSEELVDRMIQLNLNFSEQILSLNGTKH
jgi:hypothetical protein